MVNHETSGKEQTQYQIINQRMPEYCSKAENANELAMVSTFYLQCLTVGSEARDTHETLLIDLEYTLEVAINSHQLS